MDKFDIMFYIGMVAIGWIAGSLITKVCLKEEIRNDFQNPPRKTLRQAERFARQSGFDQENAERLVGTMCAIILNNDPYDDKRKSKSNNDDYEELSLDDLFRLFSE